MFVMQLKLFFTKRKFRNGKIFLRNKIVFWLFQYPRILFYRIISSKYVDINDGKLLQPTLFEGVGSIILGKVVFGVQNSPYFYSGYCYIESRNIESKIDVGNNVVINNNLVLISEGEGIFIGNNVLIGTNVEIYDSDFHDLNPKRRLGGTVNTKMVTIEDNVFIGSNVKILKGVKIGKNSVVANGSMVVKDIPENVIAGGFPCKIIRNL